MAKDKIQVFKTQELDVDGVGFSPYNPRKIDDKTLRKLKKSIKTYGLVDPIIVNKRTMNAVGGNQRLRALKDLKVEKSHFIVLDLDEEKEKALNVALNKISGEWDFGKLKDLVGGLSDTDLSLTGFEVPEIETIMENVSFDFSGLAGGVKLPNNDNLSEKKDKQPEGTESGAEDDNDDDLPDIKSEVESYTIQVSFSTKKKAEEWLKGIGVEYSFKGKNRTFVLRKD